jgi:hypothetical protein
MKLVTQSPYFSPPTAGAVGSVIQLRRIRNKAAASGFLANCDVHSVSPNLIQADGGIRNHKPRLPRPIDRNSAQQPGLLELAQRVANGGPGNRTPSFASFVVEDFSGDAPIGVSQQQPRNGNPVPGRTQPNLAQEVLGIAGQ